VTHREDEQDDAARAECGLDDDAIRVLVTRLARPHRSGGRVIERATLLGAADPAPLRFTVPAAALR
jgi:hypothetical protein